MAPSPKRNPRFAVVDRIFRELCGPGPGRVLELGCGDGRVLEMMHVEGGHEVVGLDIDRDALARARRRGIGAVVAARAEQLPFTDQSFDTVVAGFFGANLMDREAMAHEAGRVLRPGGVLVYTLLNPATRLLDVLQHDLRTLRRVRRAGLARVRSRLCNPAEEPARLRRAGLEPMALRGPLWLPVLRRFAWAQAHAPVVAGPVVWRLAWDVVVAGQKPGLAR